MCSRCNNKNNGRYYSYGGRGIKICSRWLKFENFYADMGEKPDGMTIERIDTNGDYCPENCKWATTAEQANNKRTTKYIEYNGKRQSVAAWTLELGTPGKVIRRRLYRGWSIENALTQPKVKSNKNISYK